MTAVLLVALAITTAGCTNQVTGTATQDPTQPPLALSDDGAGIVAGYPDAPVQIELYTEPQCSHCAQLQDEFGDEMARYITLGQLAVTYRPLTFLDDGNNTSHSARVANAMFLAVGPPKATEDPNTASGPEFQRATVRQGDDSRLHAANTGAQASSRLASLVGANALLALPGRIEPFAAGEEVEAFLDGELGV